MKFQKNSREFSRIETLAGHCVGSCGPGGSCISGGSCGPSGSCVPGGSCGPVGSVLSQSHMISFYVA